MDVERVSEELADHCTGGRVDKFCAARRSRKHFLTPGQSQSEDFLRSEHGITVVIAGPHAVPDVNLKGLVLCVVVVVLPLTFAQVEDDITAHDRREDGVSQGQSRLSEEMLAPSVGIVEDGRAGVEVGVILVAVSIVVILQRLVGVCRSMEDEFGDGGRAGG